MYTRLQPHKTAINDSVCHVHQDENRRCCHGSDARAYSHTVALHHGKLTSSSPMNSYLPAPLIFLAMGLATSSHASQTVLPLQIPPAHVKLKKKVSEVRSIIAGIPPYSTPVFWGTGTNGTALNGFFC